MAVPKVKFIWSFVYEENLHAPYLKGVKFNDKQYRKYVYSYIRKIEKKWNPLSNKILEYMQSISGLKFKRRVIACYVIKISSAPPFSSPLTIPIQTKRNNKIFIKSIDRFIDTLIHELIHNLFIDNDLWDYFSYILDKKYKKEKFATAIHVPLHAMHKEIFLKFFEKKRFNEELKIMKFHPAYNKSWKIVNKEGSKNIIKEMKAFIKK